MKSTIIIFIVLVLLGAGLLIWKNPKEQTIEYTPEDNTPLQTLSDGTLEFVYPENFGLAATKDQVLVSSYIPPCNEGFDYCFYYNGTEFEGTNFESAGIRIQKMPKFIESNTCINTSPEGYKKGPDGVASSTNYSSSIFSNIGDAAAGHYANGEIYRIFTNNKCYEIETRIGETQFANYEPGTVEKFEESDRDKVYTYFNSLLTNITLIPTQEKIKLSDSED